MSEEIHLNDIGTVFRVTFRDEASVIVDLSAKTTLELRFRKPSGDVIDRALTFAGTGGPADGTDGLAQYVAISGDLNETELWDMQGKVILPAGTWHSDEHNFRVHPNL